MKQKIEIEVSEGKKAVWKNNQITFVDEEPYWKSIKTFDNAYYYCLDRHNKFIKYLNSYHQSKLNTYEDKVAQLRLIIAALTNNEKLSLTEGNIWYPAIQFCVPNKKNNCFGNKVIGKIKTEGKEYLVVGGSAAYGSTAGLGCVNSYSGCSNADAGVCFIKVSSEEIAKHLSTYFGKLIFNVTYGGYNCDYQWLE